MKRYALIFALATVLALSGFGCAKKTQVEPEVTYQEPAPVTTDTYSELQSAIQQITEGRVYFAFDKFSIQPQYREMLKNKAELMKRYPNIHVQIEGNCDERGTQEYNLALGERRARAAYEYLSNLGVNRGQMSMLSNGEENPAVQGSGESIWSQNRRDEFRVTAQ